MRKDPVRFDSFWFQNFRKVKSHRFASVRTIKFPGSARVGLRSSDASWLGPVLFDSVPRPVLAGSRMHRFGWVRLGRFGSVSYSLLTIVLAQSGSTDTHPLPCCSMCLLCSGACSKADIIIIIIIIISSSRRSSSSSSSMIIIIIIIIIIIC